MSNIEIKNLCKSYYVDKQEYKILKDLNISVNYGEFIAIYGESGCGKSTFMNVLGGLDTYDSGEILINGENISTFTNKSMDLYRNRKIGFIFQEFKLLENLSLIENVMMPLNIAGVSTKEAKKRAKQLLTTVGLKDHMKKRAANLSGGQKQRVAIARALANDPDIILADEPTGALDSKTTVEILELLKSIANSGKIVIAITHSEEVAKYGNRVVNLEDGVLKNVTAPSVSVEKSEPKVKTKKDKSKLSLKKSFKIARANLLSKKFRTFLVSFGVSLGITGALVITSISQSAINDITKQFSSFQMVEEHVAVATYTESYLNSSTYEEPEQNREDEVKAIETFGKKYEGFKDVKAEYVFSGISEDEYNSPDFDKKILEDNFSMSWFASTTYLTDEDIELTFGKYPTKKFDVYYNGSIYDILYASDMLGIEGGMELSEKAMEVDVVNKNDQYYEFVDFIEEKMIGKTFTVYTKNGPIDIRITGSLELTTMSATATPYLMPYDLNEDYFESTKDSSYITGYYMEFDSVENANVLLEDMSDITSTFKSGYKDYTIVSQDFRSISMMVSNILQIVRNVFLVLTAVSLVVSLFMVNIIVYISTLERKIEIGTLRAIGAKKSNITSIFIAEGLWIGIFAFILALIGSAVMIAIVNAIIYVMAGSTGDFNTIRFSYSGLFIIAAIIFVVMIIATLLPARKASRQNPIDALREE